MLAEDGGEHGPGTAHLDCRGEFVSSRHWQAALLGEEMRQAHLAIAAQLTAFAKDLDRIKDRDVMRDHLASE